MEQGPSASARPTTLVAVPVDHTIGPPTALLDLLLAEPGVDEVLVIDDDANPTPVPGRVRVLRQPTPRGRAAAFTRAAAEAQASADAVILVLHDPDVALEPGELTRLIAAVAGGEVDAAAARPDPTTGVPPARVARTSERRRTGTTFGAHTSRVVALAPHVAARLELSAGDDDVGLELAGRLVAAGARVRELPVAWRRHPVPLPTRRALYATARFSPDRLRGDDPIRGREHVVPLDEQVAEGIVALVAPHLHGDILEIAAGGGTLTTRLTRFGRVTATEATERTAEPLRERVQANPLVDVVVADAETASALRPFDTVVAVDVLEHLPDDVAALRAFARAVAASDRGRVVLLVPAMTPSSPLDHTFDTRRYTRLTLGAALRAAGLRPLELRYVNAIGAVVGPALTGFGPRPAPRWSTRLYERAAGTWIRRIEARVPPPFGASLLCVAAPV